jgi:ribonuclease H / adenosylcobalamin/alpha-ribazole phosphatase
MTHAHVIVEADGGSRGNPGPAGYGALVRDAGTGEVIAEAAESIGHATNNVAEYRGLIAGLELYLEHTPDATLEVRMDSKLVIEQMSGRWKVRHPGMRPLAIRAQQLAPFGTVWTWVPRENNRDADRLANLAMDAAARGETVRLDPPGHQYPGDPTPESFEPPGSGPDALPAGTPVPPATGAGRAVRGAGHPLLGWVGGLGEATTVILLRHGVTAHTAERRFSGPGGEDPGLNGQGVEQVRRAATSLGRRGLIDAIVASPLRRTLESAAEVAIALETEVIVDDGFREASFGEWDGLTVTEVEERWPRELEAWVGSPDVAPPGGESMTSVRERVERSLEKTLVSHRGGTVVVVSHVNPIKLAVRYCLDAPFDVVNRLLVAPASLTTLSFYESGASALRQFSALP